VTAVSEEHVLNLLSASCEQHGGIRKFARAKGVPHSTVAAALAGTRRVTHSLATTVGYMQVARFEPIKRPHDAA
jgi:hypothetical protein